MKATDPTTISTKGQVTIPSAVRERLNLKPGDKVRFIIDDNGSAVIFPVKGTIRDLYGFLPPPKKPVSDDEMEEGVAKSVSDRFLGHGRD